MFIMELVLSATGISLSRFLQRLHELRLPQRLSPVSRFYPGRDFLDFPIPLFGIRTRGWTWQFDVLTVGHG
jgi:hypothetical protein